MRFPHPTAALGLLAMFASLLLCVSTAYAEPHLPGLNPAELATRADCSAPAPGHASCAAEQLLYSANDSPVRSVTTAGRSTAGGAPAAAGPAVTPAGYGPSELQSAYDLKSLAATQGAGKTIALVDAYDDPNAETDLSKYRSEFGLPPCTTECFTKVEQSGTPHSPSGKNDWTLEVSLDLDMASAICPNCKILLVEAQNTSLGALAAAAHTAATTPGVVAVSNSYTAKERESHPEWGAYESDYAQPGVAFTAAAGDSSYQVNYPAVLSTVTSVGGTSLQPGAGGWTQRAWSGTGGGCSEYVGKPSWQASLGAADAECSMRANNDVSADADPTTGIAVYDTYNSNGGWNVVGGTSASSPIVAGFYALIGQEAGDGSASWDYAHPNYFTDVIGGSNLSPCSSYLCEAVDGYDGPTGLGTPNGEGTGGPVKGGGTGSPEGGVSEIPPSGASQPVSTSSAAPVATSPPPASSSSVSSVPVLSGLALTRSALITLNRARPKVSAVSFAFGLNAPARVLVTFSRRVRVHGHMVWKNLPYSLTITAKEGRSGGHLRARGALAPGSYRLTLAPMHGSPRSISLQIG